MDPKLLQDLLESRGYLLNKLEYKASYHGGYMFTAEGYCPKETKETNTMKTKITTQSQAVAAIKTSGFIIGSVDLNGTFSTAVNPVVHQSASDARMECKRLAQMSPGKLFFFTRFMGAEMVPNSVVSI